MDNKNIVEISKRRIFDKKLGPLYFLILSLFLPVTLILIFDYSHFYFITFILLLALCVLSILLMINLLFVIQGIEIDLEKNLIRRYRKIFLLKYGHWIDFSDFKIVSITSDHLTLSRSNSGGFESHFYYYVSLENEFSKLNIRIDEFDNYYKAYSFALKTSVVFNLELKDNIKGKTVVNGK